MFILRLCIYLGQLVFGNAKVVDDVKRKVRPYSVVATLVTWVSLVVGSGDKYICRLVEAAVYVLAVVFVDKSSIYSNNVILLYVI